jgi:hypothetical protein
MEINVQETIMENETTTTKTVIYNQIIGAITTLLTIGTITTLLTEGTAGTITTLLTI